MESKDETDFAKESSFDIESWIEAQGIQIQRSFDHAR